MAQSTLPVLSSPDFPQVLAQAIDRIVNRVIEALAEAHLSCCAYESPESSAGACDSMPCIQKATIFHLESERELCADHFRAVNRD
jgi:hypothetical protein